MTEIIIVKNLYKIFGDHPQKALRLIDQGVDKEEVFARTSQVVGVNDASFTINEGEIFVIMGLSGSGKSTMVRLLNRLIEPTRGSILFAGEDIAKMSDKALLALRRDKMSMVFQSFALMPHLTVLDNAAFGLELSGIGYTERRERATTALEQVGLAPYADNYPDELSGGMKQRVGLARALANDPEVMLMDEAFSALDPLIRCEMQDELLKLQAEHKRTIVFISHDLDEAMRIGDRIAIMEGGRVVQVGTPEDILNNPADDYVRSFFRGVDVAKVLTAGDIARKTQVTVLERDGAGLNTALKRLQSDDRDYGYVVCNELKLQGIVSVDSLAAARRKGDAKLANAFIDNLESVKADTQLTDLLAVVAKTPYAVPVTTPDGCYLGVITKANLLETLAPDDEPAETENATPETETLSTHA